MPENLDPIFVTIAMAEILLGQNLPAEAQSVIGKLSASHAEDPRVKSLCERVEEMSRQQEPVAIDPKGLNFVLIETAGKSIMIHWEMTEEGLAAARKKARYSGQSILRLFSAVPGPRGVRTSIQDIEISAQAAKLELRGLQRPAVHVAAIGFLSNTGEFVSLAHSETLEAAQ